MVLEPDLDPVKGFGSLVQLDLTKPKLEAGVPHGACQHCIQPRTVMRSS